MKVKSHEVMMCELHLRKALRAELLNQNRDDLGIKFILDSPQSH